MKIFKMSYTPHGSSNCFSRGEKRSKVNMIKSQSSGLSPLYRSVAVAWSFDQSTMRRWGYGCSTRCDLDRMYFERDF